MYMYMVHVHVVRLVSIINRPAQSLTLDDLTIIVSLLLFVIVYYYLCCLLAMAATTISNHVCLFWYNVSDWSLYYYNMSSASVNIYSQLEEYTVILSIAPHDNEGFTTS